jgi:predicted nucleic acid-binding protein
MNSRVVVDSSVIVKWVVAHGEGGLDAAAMLLRDQREGTVKLVAPAFAAVEVGNVMRYIGVGSEDAAGLLCDIAAFGVHLLPDSHERIRRALELGFEHAISVYDALYLALAQELDCPFVTADRRAFGSVHPDVAEVRLIL